MEIKYPIIIIISIILFVTVFFVFKKKSPLVKNKNKIANTDIIKNTKEYKTIIKRYRLFLYLFYGLIFICVLSSSILSSRIIEEQESDDETYNRDIMLCMDVSSSVIELDGKIIDTYKAITSDLKGERIGISIFNSTSSLLVPLTDDYDYLSSILEKLSLSIESSQTDRDTFMTNHGIEDINEYYNINYYYYLGTSTEYDRGSSLIGDGLASCIFDFPNLEEKRSRIIIFSTDNDVFGKEYINLSDASEISKNKKITIYAIPPKDYHDEKIEELKKAAEKTGGKMYVETNDSTVKDIVKEIDNKEKTKLKKMEKTVITDHPIIPLIISISSFILVIIIDKVVLS